METWQKWWLAWMEWEQICFASLMMEAISYIYRSTKLIVTGCGINNSDRAPILVWDSEWVCWSVPISWLHGASTGRIDAEVDCPTAKASMTFGAMHQAVFKDCHLTVTTKQKVYEACALSILLYGSECWTPMHRHLNRPVQDCVWCHCATGPLGENPTRRDTNA